MQHYDDYDDFLERMQEFFDNHHYGDLTPEREEWIQVLWDQYSYEGYIDWDDHSKDDSFWYYYMTEVLGYSDEDIEKYFS